MLLCQFREIAELNDVDIIGVGLNTSACRERGKSTLRSVKEALDTTVLIPPQDLGPLWVQIEDSGDCCGFIVTTRNVANWQVARHGSLQ